MYIKEIRNSFTSLKPFGIDAQLSPGTIMEIKNPRNIQKAIDQKLVKEVEPILSSNGRIIGYKDKAIAVRSADAVLSPALQGETFRDVPQTPSALESEVDKDVSINSGS